MIQSRNQFSVPTRRQGLTLMELVVVLVILIALAGILLPLLPSLLTKAHDSVTTTNISEIDKAITGYLGTTLSYPNQFDSLVDASGSMYAGLLFNPLNANSAYNGSAASGLPFTVGPLTPQSGSPSGASGPAASLTLGGINALMVMSTSTVSPPAFDATYGAYVGVPGVSGSTAAVTANSNVVYASSAYVLQRLNVQPRNDSNGVPARYVVFGLGPYCTIIGARSFGVFNAPVAFGEHSFEQPNVSYARYLIVFRVYDDGARCEYIGAAHDDATGFGTFDMHLQEYYQTGN
jgi:type II secretory pathway pseudopilin PulG